MSELGPRLSWGQWARIHGKAICQAIPLSIILIAEAKDMYYRATWQVENVPAHSFKTGDVVAICNRWYTLPRWSHKLYSLLSKVLLKSSWDDVGVVYIKDNVPYLIYVDFLGAHTEPLADFLAIRSPRGAAIRRLVCDPSPIFDSTAVRSAADRKGPNEINNSIASVFVEEVLKLKPRPWYLFSASMRNGSENKYYDFCVGMNRQRQHIKEMIAQGRSKSAQAAQIQSLNDMEVMRAHLAQFVTRESSFHLFNGSLVASFFAAYNLLERDIPPPSRYVPQDFAHHPPFIGATCLEEPIVFFKN